MERNGLFLIVLLLLLLFTWQFPGCHALSHAASTTALPLTTIASSTTKLLPLSSEIHLISFLRPDWKIASAQHRRFWSWKIDVMGLAMTETHYKHLRFAERILEYSNQHSLPQSGVNEVLFISNCKRIEVVLATKRSTDPVQLAQTVVNMLEECVDCWENETNKTSIPVLQQSEESLIIQSDDDTDPPASCSSTTATTTLPRFVTITSGTANVARYLCRVAAGLPPEAPSLGSFAPFLARDAHVLAQFKQAFQAASSSSFSHDDYDKSVSLSPPCQGRLSALMRGSLQAGKRARNPTAVPCLQLLQSSAPPKPRQEQVIGVAQIVLDQVVEPAVVEIVNQVSSIDRGKVIQAFRQQALVGLDDKNYGGNKDLRRAVRRELHAPTMALRQGHVIDQDAIFQRIAKLVHTSGGD